VSELKQGSIWALFGFCRETEAVACPDWGLLILKKRWFWGVVSGRRCVGLGAGIFLSGSEKKLPGKNKFPEKLFAIEKNSGWRKFPETIFWKIFSKDFFQNFSKLMYDECLCVPVPCSINPSNVDASTTEKIFKNLQGNV